jgi:hypothetical protein
LIIILLKSAKHFLHAFKCIFGKIHAVRKLIGSTTKHESAAVRDARDYDEGVEKLVRAEQLDTAIRLAPMPIIIFSVILPFIVWRLIPLAQVVLPIVS